MSMVEALFWVPRPRERTGGLEGGAGPMIASRGSESDASNDGERRLFERCDESPDGLLGLTKGRRVSGEEERRLEWRRCLTDS